MACTIAAMHKQLGGRGLRRFGPLPRGVGQSARVAASRVKRPPWESRLFADERGSDDARRRGHCGWRACLTSTKLLAASHANSTTAASSNTP